MRKKYKVNTLEELLMFVAADNPDVRRTEVVFRDVSASGQKCWVKFYWEGECAVDTRDTARKLNIPVGIIEATASLWQLYRTEFGDANPKIYDEVKAIGRASYELRD